MASVVPSKDLDAVQFFETHIPIWNAALASVGVTGPQVAQLDAATKACRGAFTKQQAAKDAAKATTTTFQNDATTMRSIGGDLIKSIKAFAATTYNPDVYGIAQIPMPAAPSPVPPPGQPTDFKIGLTGSGAVQPTWKCTSGAASTGAFFVVTRKLAGESVFTTVGNIGAKKFTDNTIPQGVTGATYLVQGFRGDHAGEVSLPVGVQFGVSAGGGNVQAAPLKMAA